MNFHICVEKYVCELLKYENLNIRGDSAYAAEEALEGVGFKP